MTRNTSEKANTDILQPLNTQCKETSLPSSVDFNFIVDIFVFVLALMQEGKCKESLQVTINICFAWDVS